MTVHNRTSDEIIRKAKLAYSLDMITELALEDIIKKATTQPGYKATFDLPFDWDIEEELRLRKEHGRWGWFWKIIDWFSV